MYISLKDISMVLDTNIELEKAIVVDIDTLENVEILDIDVERGYIKVAYIGKDKVSIDNQIIIHVDSNLNIRNVENESIRIHDLKVGQSMHVTTNGIMTKSRTP